MKEVGGIMNDKNLAYCSECEDLVEFTEKEEVIEETYTGNLYKLIHRFAYHFISHYSSILESLSIKSSKIFLTVG